MIERFLKEYKWNSSSIFLLPSIGLNIKELELMRIGFENTYLNISSGKRQDCDNPLYVLFKKPINDGGIFSDFLITQYNKNELLIDEIDYDNHTVLVYCIPEEYNGDYELFLSGKYSKFSRKFRGLFRKHFKAPDGTQQYTLAYNVIYKIPDWKKEVEEYFETQLDNSDELWTIPDKDKETLKIDEICTMR